MALIDVEALSFGYAAGALVLDGVTLSIGEGERVAILGGNGSGKTTLAHWLAGWLPRGSHAARAGRVTTGGRPWAALEAGERSALVQFVGQVPMQQLSGFAFTVYDEVVFGPCNLALPEAEVRAHAARALDLCRLNHLLDRDPFTLSGGEQQRLSVAAALAMEPRALILDEPTGNLDPESRDDLLARLRALPRDLTLVLLDVTLGPALELADRFLLLDQGRIVFDGDAAALVSHALTRERFGLPAVAEAALLLRESGSWPPGRPLPLDVEAAALALEEAS